MRWGAYPLRTVRKSRHVSNERGRRRFPALKTEGQPQQGRVYEGDTQKRSLGKMAHSQNSPPPPPDGASSGSPAVASALSEHGAGEAPAKKP